MDANKTRALAAAPGLIEEQFGKGPGMRMGDGAWEAGGESAACGSPVAAPRPVASPRRAAKATP